MLDSIGRFLAERNGLQLARDLLDVVIVYYVVYRALMVLRGTRAMQVGVGLGMVFLLYVVANFLQLATVLSVLGALISSIILVIVVVFQNDIRRGLQRVGSRALFGGIGRAQETKVIDEVVEAATELARHRIGAIITFEQDANLDEFVGVHKGHILDAAVSRELLVSLFVPEGVNKLHDGFGSHPQLPHREGGRVLPDARGPRARRQLRDATPGGVGHHRRDGRCCRGRERRARDHQLLLQRQHRVEPRRSEAAHDAGGHLQPQGPRQEEEVPARGGRSTGQRRRGQRAHAAAARGAHQRVRAHDRGRAPLGHPERARARSRA